MEDPGADGYIILRRIFLYRALWYNYVM